MAIPETAGHQQPLPPRAWLFVSLSIGHRQVLFQPAGLQIRLGALILDFFKIENTSNHQEARMAGAG